MTDVHRASADRGEQRACGPTPDGDRYRLLVESVTDYAILLLDPWGCIQSWNPGARRIKGWTADEVVGRHFSIFYPRESVENGWPEEELARAKRDGRFEDEGWRIRKDGSAFWANVVITALRDPSGELVGFAKITRDLSERRAEEDRIRRAEERLRLFVDGVKDYAMYFLDEDGRVSSWNAGAERIHGWSAQEVLGRGPALFYPPEDVAADKPKLLLSMAHANGRVHDEGRRLRRDGSVFWADVVITALHDAQGEFSGYAQITRDLTERRRVEALESARRQIHEFLAMLSHELRNPLAPIRNALEVMRAEAVEDPGLVWSRDIIDRQVSHLTRLVDDLLDVSRITTGKIALRREPLDLRNVLDRAVEASRPAVNARRHSLDWERPSDAIHVYGDSTRLAQVVINLLQNASKYTPPGGQIRLSASVEGSDAAIRVRDDGIGISEDLLPRVFDLFTQADRGLDRQEGGLGIGLTLVRRLTELHGGRVEAHSAGIGKGSEFVVRLPLFNPETARFAGLPRDREAPPPPPAEARRVLVVDDNRDAAESLAVLLRAWGHETVFEADGDHALATAAKFRPDVALLDLGLPRMDGYELSARLKRLPGLEDVTLVALTGYGQEEDRRRTQQAGFEHHLVKPVDALRLKRIVATAPIRARKP